MPRGRKSAAAKAASGGQSTLSFNNKSARVTKSGAQAQRDEQAATAKKLSQIEGSLQHEERPATAEVKVKEEPQATEPKLDVDEDDQPEAAQIVEEDPEEIRPATTRRKVKAVKGKDERELAAEKVTDAQLKKYWQQEEDARLAPRGMYAETNIVSFYKYSNPLNPYTHFPISTQPKKQSANHPSHAQSTKPNSPSTKRSYAISTSHRNTAHALASPALRGGGEPIRLD